MLGNGNEATSTNTNTNEPSAGSGASPKEIYLSYHREFDQMKSFDEYIALVKKYGSREFTGKLSQFDSYPQELKDTTFALVKSSSPKTSDFTNIQETISGDTATLVISTSNPKLTGNIKLKKENGVWKLIEDHWSQAA